MKLFKLSLLALIILFSGCTVNVAVKPNVKTDSYSKISTTVGLFVEENDFKHRATGLFFVGGGNTFIIDVGRVLETTAEKSFKNIFDQVELVSNYKETTQLNNKYTIVLEPSFAEYYVSQTMSSGLRVRLKVVDANKQTLYTDETSVEGSAGPLVLSTSTFGFTSAEAAISASSQDAYEKAFKKLLTNLFQNYSFEI